ncbi:hypothetical protein ACO22_02302 [Paracoccidioides brasiliensis]|uniref:BTB domain-containing protein n=1 Tax=Paracoccidioides brasiliensis TaxID=121759 RepID=A0A1D2JJ71_PARBR|nr:hypothetical protein ACO22_02302 [Paracoccidioides brasiliensis]
MQAFLKQTRALLHYFAPSFSTSGTTGSLNLSANSKEIGYTILMKYREGHPLGILEICITPYTSAGKRSCNSRGGLQMANLKIKRYGQPGFDPDTRLIVFDEELHVNSAILRLHSQFFQTLLDHYDVDENIQHDPHSSFRYEYVLKGGYDGVYGLQPLGNVKSGIGDADGRDNEIEYHSTVAELRETWNLEQLMNAFYVKPSTIEDLEELEELVRTADFYSALPIVSKFVESSLQISEELLYNIPKFPIEHAVKILCLARKLEASSLFRETFIHVIAFSNSDDGHSYKGIIEELKLQHNEDLIPLVTRYHALLCKEIANANFFLMKCCLNQEHLILRPHATSKDRELALISEVIRHELQPGNGYANLERFSAGFYQKLCDAPFAPTSNQALRYGENYEPGTHHIQTLSRQLQQKVVAHVRKGLWPVTRNCLQFNYPRHTAEYQPGRRDAFLCTQLEDSDLPWHS